MMKTHKAQTSTEYLIILAVVIVIALIVVGVLGGIPSIGGGAGKRAIDAQMRTAEIGIDNYFVNSTHAKILVKNNLPETVILQGLSVDGKELNVKDGPCNNHFPKTLRVGQTELIECTWSDFIDHSTGRTAPIIKTRYQSTSTRAIYHSGYGIGN